MSDYIPVNQRGGTPLSKGTKPYTNQKPPTVAPKGPAGSSMRSPMTDPVHPDQPYTPSTDEEQWTDDEQLMVDRICAILGTVVWRNGDIRAFDFADALLPIIAEVRTAALEEAAELLRREADRVAQLKILKPDYRQALVDTFYEASRVVMRARSESPR